MVNLIASYLSGGVTVIKVAVSFIACIIGYENVSSIIISFLLQTLSRSQNKLHLFHSLILSRSRCCSRCSSLSSLSLPNFLVGQQCLPLSGVKGSCLCEQAKTAGRNCERTRDKLCWVYIAICVRLSFRGLYISLLACSEKRDFYMNFY